MTHDTRRADAVSALKAAAVTLTRTLYLSEHFDEDASTDDLEAAIGAVYSVIRVALDIEYGRLG